MARFWKGCGPCPIAGAFRCWGGLGAHVVGPLAGLRARVRRNLDLVAPDLPKAERERWRGRFPATWRAPWPRSSPAANSSRGPPGQQVEGTGLAALHQAHAKGQPVILVTGHLGNYDAARALLLAQGFNVAGFYMPMRNPAFNARYVAAISRIGTPVFARGRDGLAAMLRFLRKGGMVGLVADHYMAHGELLDFMGQPARTALSAAEMALKYNALLVPVYGIRQPDGLKLSRPDRRPDPA